MSLSGLHSTAPANGCVVRSHGCVEITNGCVERTDGYGTVEKTNGCVVQLYLSPIAATKTKKHQRLHGTTHHWLHRKYQRLRSTWQICAHGCVIQSKAPEALQAHSSNTTIILYCLCCYCSLRPRNTHYLSRTKASLVRNLDVLDGISGSRNIALMRRQTHIDTHTLLHRQRQE